MPNARMYSLMCTRVCAKMNAAHSRWLAAVGRSAAETLAVERPRQHARSSSYGRWTGDGTELVAGEPQCNVRRRGRDSTAQRQRSFVTDGSAGFCTYLIEEGLERSLAKQMPCHLRWLHLLATITECECV